MCSYVEPDSLDGEFDSPPSPPDSKSDSPVYAGRGVCDDIRQLILQLVELVDQLGQIVRQLKHALNSNA